MGGEAEFGSDYLTVDGHIVYSHKNKVLLVQLDGSKIKSYKYLKLNTENIDNDLIQQIVVQH